MSDEILRRLDDLKQGQLALRAELKSEVADLRSELLVAVRESNEVTLAALEGLSSSLSDARQEISGVQKDVLIAVRQSNEAILAAISALHSAYRSTREDVRQLREVV